MAKSNKNQENLLFILMGVIIIGLIIAGFFLFQKQFSGRIKEELGLTASKNMPSANIPAEVESKNTKQEEYIPQDEVKTIQIYYGVKGKDTIDCENKRVRRNNMLIGQARQIVNSLLEAPSDEKLYKLLPDELVLRGLFYEAGLYTIDFSREFTQIGNYGASEQTLAIYSIVNSITELDPNAKVRFLVNGTEPDIDSGHLDLTDNFTRLEKVIEKEL